MKIIAETELRATVVAKGRTYDVPKDVADELGSLRAERKKDLEAMRDTSSKIHDAADEKINWRRDFTFRIDARLRAFTIAPSDADRAEA